LAGGLRNWRQRVVVVAPGRDLHLDTGLQRLAQVRAHGQTAIDTLMGAASGFRPISP
jgi:hypothetical protein